MIGTRRSPSLHESYRICEQISRTRAGNFYPAFRVLPRPQKRAMCALYAFLRIADDLSDEAGPLEDKRRALADWRTGLRAALQGEYRHPIHAALQHTTTSFAIPPHYLEAAIDGVEMDLVADRYGTFGELRTYCYHVASVVGLACIHIWGFTDPRAEIYAEQAGIAFQLTNILRDLGEDAARGRVYLPEEDLRRFGYAAEELRRGRRSDPFRELMRFQVERTRTYYRQSQPLAGLLRPPGRAVFLMMARTYEALLDAIERRDYDVFSQRVSLSRWHKLWLALRALPVRYGLLPQS
jgi:phytoene synthase